MTNACGCGNRHVPGRACTPDAKRLALARLLAAWERHPQARLGQLIVNTIRDPFFESALFAIEDDALLERMEGA